MSCGVSSRRVLAWPLRDRGACLSQARRLERVRAQSVLQRICTMVWRMAVQVVVRDKEDQDARFDRALMYIEVGESKKVPPPTTTYPPPPPGEPHHWADVSRRAKGLPCSFPFASTIGRTVSGISHPTDGTIPTGPGCVRGDGGGAPRGPAGAHDAGPHLPQPAAARQASTSDRGIHLTEGWSVLTECNRRTGPKGTDAGKNAISRGKMDLCDFKGGFGSI